MVLESIVRAEWVIQSPIYALPFGLSMALLGLAVGLVVFPSEASLVAILFTVIAALPFIREVLKYEEYLHKPSLTMTEFLNRNKNIMKIYFFFFVGIVIVYFILYYILPDVLLQTLFAKQSSLFNFSGNRLPPTNIAALFQGIILNNIKILLLSLVLSLVFGAGALMILTWNASVLGIFLVNLSSKSILYTIPHASLEFIAFFLAAVGGGLISFAVEREQFQSEKFREVITDGLLLFLLATSIIIIAALLEVTIGIKA